VSLSELVVPVLLCFTACYALGKRVDVYTALTRGAEEGAECTGAYPPLAHRAADGGVYVPFALALLSIWARCSRRRSKGSAFRRRSRRSFLSAPISGSGALAVGSELTAPYGPDSYIGRVAAVMLGSSETTFYTIAVYFGSVGIVKTRYTIPASLCADAVMFLTSAAAVRVLMG